MNLRLSSGGRKAELKLCSASCSSCLSERPRLAAREYSVSRSVWKRAGSSVESVTANAALEKYAAEDDRRARPRLAKLPRERAGAQIAGRTIVEHHAPSGERFRQAQDRSSRQCRGRCARRREFDGFANVFGTADFACVTNDVKASVTSQIKSGAEIGGGKAKLRRRPCRRRRLRNGESLTALRATSFAASAPNWRTQSKIQAVRRRLNEAICDSLPDGREIRFDVLHAAQHHADRNGNFRVNDVLQQKLFEQPTCDQSVVFRIAQERSDPFEDVDEAREIGISDSGR